ncbi:MAG: hypothetical protein II039_02860 [Treponema sp.]|nr:hypothetical protein [Treponema sp.]MBQ2354231.1 hypothetical protein [Treponema sp.]
MKRLFFLVFCLAILLSSGLAYAEYDGDLQLNAGYAHLSVSRDDRNVDDSESSENFALGFSNHNLWSISDLFSVGFMEKLDFSFGDLSGDEDKFCFEIGVLCGPSVGFSINQNISVILGAGFVVGGAAFSGEEDSSVDWVGFGGGTDLQVKFLASKFVSPVIGFSWLHFSSDEITLTISEHSYDFAVDTTTNVFRAYAGVSLNF